MQMQTLLPPECWRARILKPTASYLPTHRIFMTDHFQKQIRFWGIAPSYAFVAEPETNGVIERLFRTLQEQLVHGRIFQTIDEVRDAVRAFAARYNTEWLIEKNGHRSPLDARAAWLEQTFSRAA